MAVGAGTKSPVGSHEKYRKARYSPQYDHVYHSVGVCPSCGARFYDLSRTPITCPVCQAAYQVTPPPSRRGERGQSVEVRKVVEPELEASAPETPDIIGLKEVEEAGVKTAIEEDEQIVDLIGDAAEIP